MLLEVLRGASSEARAAQIEAWLQRFHLVAMLAPERAPRIAAAYRRLRAEGITPGLADLAIGCWCAEHAVPLLHRDAGLARMAGVLGFAQQPA
jgi:predicted nucleic acid-binding protein